MTNNNPRAWHDDSDNSMAGEIGHTVRRSLDSWGRTARLCVIAVTAATLWGGITAVGNLTQHDQPPVASR